MPNATKAVRRRSHAPEHPPDRAPASSTKVSFNLPQDELDALRQLAERRHTTATQVIRQALATELLLQDIVDDGQTLIAKDGRRGRELFFSQMTNPGDRSRS